jgi:PAS domain S-box-containing protein
VLLLLCASPVALYFALPGHRALAACVAAAITGAALAVALAGCAHANQTLRRSSARLRRHRAAGWRKLRRAHKLLTAATDYAFSVRIREDGEPSPRHTGGITAITGYQPCDLDQCASLWFDIAHPSDRPAVLVQAANALAGQEAAPLEYRIRHRNGSQVWLRTIMVTDRDQTGRIDGYDCLVSNITRRKLIEQALKTSEQRFRSLLEDAPVAVALLRNHRCLYRNRMALRLFGPDQANDPLPLALTQRTEPQPPDGPELPLRDANPLSGDADGTEMSIRGATGVEIPVHISISQANLPDGPATIAFLTDMTERKQAEAAVRQTTLQLRALSSRLQSLREEERTRIAREIHDHLGQLLTALKLDLRSLERKCGHVPSPELRASLIEKITSARELADETITSVRRIAAELRPGVLDRLGLAAAIQTEAAAFERRSGIRCQYLQIASPRPLQDNLSTAMYRIFQELMTNVARHSRATQVVVRLSFGPEELILEVIDDGVGIGLRQPAGGDSLGLLGMRERAAQLGGTLAFGRNLKAGTHATVRLPLAATPSSP